MKRPLSVWTVLVVLALAILIAIPPTLTWTAIGFQSLWGSARNDLAILFFVEFAIRVAILALLVASLWTIARRAPAGRGLGLTALVLLFVIAAYAKLTALPAGQGLPKFQYDTPAERGGAFMLDVAAVIWFVVLFYRFGFSARARQYFGSSTATPEAIRPGVDAA
jgi:hypothetical protein